MTESQVIAILGKPKEETENDGEKIYSYNEMSIGFENSMIITDLAAVVFTR